MIGRERVLELLSNARFAERYAHPAWRRVQAAEQAELLTEFEKMRAIVEDLAMIKPRRMTMGALVACPLCGMPASQHDDRCLVSRAVVLAGKDRE